MHFRAYLLVGLAAFFAALLFFAHVAAAQNSTVNPNLTGAINSTQMYIAQANESGYLVFYPNLTTAYRDLALAQNESDKNLSRAYALLADAKASAGEQESIIYQYRDYSLYVLIALTIVLLYVLYELMKRRIPTQKSK